MRDFVYWLLQDELYVKKMLLYHGGKIFGKGADDPKCLAKTVLGIMVSCLYGGPNFQSKVQPIAKLTLYFLKEEVDGSIDNIHKAGGTVKAVICDGNRNNQSLFKAYDTTPETPWLTKDGLFLLYDPVHLLKNIRNNWITERCQELKFWDGEKERVAKWSHLKELYKLKALQVY